MGFFLTNMFVSDVNMYQNARVKGLGVAFGLHLRGPLVSFPLTHSQQVHKTQAAGIRQSVNADVFVYQKFGKPRYLRPSHMAQ